MEYTVIGLFIMAAIIVLWIVKKKHTELQPSEEKRISLHQSSAEAVHQSKAEEEFTIPIEIFPADTLNEKSVLTEISDSKILAHIDQVIPGLLQAGIALDTAARTAETGTEVVYRAILPAGAKLVNSRDMEGAVRGFYRGPNGIGGHADLVQKDSTGGVSAAANTAAAMSVASMVVGQYYMTQINTELGKISDDISNISNFQNNEFRSRVFALFTYVKKIAAFQDEIIENQELRCSKINQLNSLEEECIKLLGQANLTLADIAKKTGLDFSAYENEVQSAQNWKVYQETLFAALYQISDLRFTLHLGAVSRDACNSMISEYKKQIADTQRRLNDWHQEAANRLGINVADSVRKRTGIDKVVHYIPGLVDNSKNFKAVQDGTSEMITHQTSTFSCRQDQSNLYAEDVQLISMNGKIYFCSSENQDGKELQTKS